MSDLLKALKEDRVSNQHQGYCWGNPLQSFEIFIPYLQHKPTQFTEITARLKFFIILVVEE